MESNNNNFIPALGAFISPADPRDWTLASVGAPSVYPDKCFLDTSWFKVSNQMQIGCCVGCTGEYIFRLILAQIYGVQPQELSFRFLYSIAKCLDGITEEGTYGATIAKVMRDYGIPLAKFCPNETTLSHESFVYNRRLANIPKEAMADAATRKGLVKYFTESATEEGLKKAINYAKANNGGVMLIRLIGTTYWTDKDGNYTWDKNKILPIRLPKSFPYGHAEAGVGYDIEPGTGRMRVYWIGSWSENWADKGYAWEYADIWLPYFREIRVIVKDTPVVDTFKYEFTKTLNRGMKGPDVVALQHVLKIEKCFPETQDFTGYYGDTTLNGVMQLQEKYASEILAPLGLKHGTGVVGSATLAWLIKHYGITK